jgi:glycine cleavage system H lipoate-binding protein
VSKFKFPKELLAIEVPEDDGSFVGITELGNLDEGDVVAVYELREVKRAVVTRGLVSNAKKARR